MPRGYYSYALYAAAALRNTKVATQLIERGADVNAVSSYYSTALQAAA
jgi:ankyrin repeat protein